MGSSNEFEHGKGPAILLAATVWWPLSARLAMRFLEYGCRVSAVCPRGHLLRHVDGVERVFPYRGLSSLDSLEKAIRQASPDLVVPCDDRVVWQLHELYSHKPDLRPLIDASLGVADSFETIERRDLLLETAQTLGIRIPTTRCVRSEEEIHRWFAEVEGAAVLKLDGTFSGDGVAIAHSEREAIKVFRKFSRRVSLSTTLKRLVINRNPLSLWNWSRRTQPIVTIQQLIDGRPANSMLACWKGDVLSIASVEVLASEGPTGAAFLVRLIDSLAMTKAAHLLAKRLQLTGFVGLDFLIEKVSGRPYLIEMNPRCTQLGHLPLTGGSDLVGALCAKLGCGPCMSNAASIEGQPIAFFPQATRWGANRSLAGKVYNDVPQGQPELVRELLQPIWPDRQWISRIYHLFSPAPVVEPVEFSVGAVRKESAPENTANRTSMDSPHS